MSDTNEAVAQKPVVPTSLKDVEAVRDLFARAHDYIAQASHPGHMGYKVAEVLNFLAFQYNDFKLRAENLAKAEASRVDVDAAKAAVDAALGSQAEALGNGATQPETAQESPKA